MTNNYDAQDLDAPRYQAPPHPVTKSQLVLSLQDSIREAQNLANYYENVTKQLTLLANQIEQTK